MTQKRGAAGKIARFFIDSKLIIGPFAHGKMAMEFSQLANLSFLSYCIILIIK